MDFDKTKSMLKRHEGYRQFVYKDSVGIATIGIGRNLENRGVFENEALYMLDNDVRYFADKLSNELYFFAKLDDVRKSALIDMAFNLGTKGLLAFKKTLAFIAVGDFLSASKEMLDSSWSRQVGSRAKELSDMIASGKWSGNESG